MTLPRRRPRLAFAIACLLLIALAYPSMRGSLYVRREVLRTADRVGIMSGGLGGQILRYNFYREPAWVHWVAGGVGAGVGFAPLVVLQVVIARRMSGASRDTRCGSCGAAIERYGGLARDGDALCCPRCRTAVVTT